MARYRGPKTKIARRFREPIFGPDKTLEREKTMVQDNMVLQKEEENNLNMLFSLEKNKKQNILTVFWSVNLETYLVKLLE